MVHSVNPSMQLARAVRERFLQEMGHAMTELGATVLTRLTELLDEPCSSRESQLRRDVWMAYKRCRPLWVESTLKMWRECLDPAPAEKKSASSPEPAGLELVGTDVVENKILASRLVMTVNDKVQAPLDDLRVRIKFLEKIEDLSGKDILRPEVLVLYMVEQWNRSGMPGDSWLSVNDTVQTGLIASLKKAYENCNALLISKGVLPTIELKDRVRAPVRAVASRAPAAVPSGAASASAPLQRPEMQGSHGADTGHASAHASVGSSTFWRPSSGGVGVARDDHHASGDANMMAATPLARARVRAQGVIGQIRRLFTSYTGGEMASAVHPVQTPALVEAIRPQVTAASYASGGTLYMDYSPAGVVRVADDLREKTAELKKKAETKGEKATIEIVALMFQSILTEDRIPPGIRVWFARLQMPVLRVALEDPDFLGTTEHPARMLIDRMGSCVMGFDAAGVEGHAMEVEVRRIVQVIEQYPETGKKVYEIVYEEFQRFLSKFLTVKESAQKVVSVAQQVEQKETLTIQFTIELRSLLQDMPVRDEIRDFLFKVWAEVLAVSAVRKGPKHADTLTLKKSASDLVWSASAKPNRADRARVIQDLPSLLARLRAGMTLLTMAPPEQEAHIKKISDTLADAFLSKTQAIAQDKIDALAERLSSLEDFVSEDGVGDLPLDAESIEMMLGIDAADIEVVANGGAKPTAAMQAWAQELDLGSWFTLDHNSQVVRVQLAWSSERKHLNLFATPSGKSFLIQSGRLAAYLQAGLLLPQEEETLTVRAARDAMTKLEANPERLLS